MGLLCDQKYHDWYYTQKALQNNLKQEASRVFVKSGVALENYAADSIFTAVIWQVANESNEAALRYYTRIQNYVHVAVNKNKQRRGQDCECLSEVPTRVGFENKSLIRVHLG